MKPSEANAAFDPSLEPVYCEPGASGNGAKPANCRELFYALIHISEHYQLLPCIHHYLTRHLQHIEQHYPALFTTAYDSADLQKLIDNAAFHHPPETQNPALSEFLTHYAPVFFTELSWLAALTQTATSNSPLSAQLMSVYLRLTKNQQSIAAARSGYYGHLLALGIEMPDLHTIAFIKQTEICEEVFDLSCIQLAFSLFPRVFFPELLGFTLSYCCALSLPEQFFSAAPNQAGLPSFIQIRNQRRRQELSVLQTIAASYLSAFPGSRDELWRRIQSGFWLYQIQLELCYQRLHAQLQTVLSPRQAMHLLLPSLMSGAIGHHGRIRLGGKTIDEWFKETPFKSENFLATLLHSPYVDRKKPENSQFLKLFEFNGPMFGVLDEQSKVIVKDWLLSELDPEQIQRNKITPERIKARFHKYGLQRIANEPPKIEGLFEPLPDNKTSAVINFNQLNNKELYYYLVNNELYPESAGAARRRVERIFTWARLLSRLPFRRYSHENLDKHIQKLYQREVNNYKPMGAKPALSKKAYLWGIEQFAPTILADGCWLQNARQLSFYPAHHAGALLQKIYADEAGNGVFEQNHPHIYQALLDSVAIELPPIHSKEFIQHPGFLPSAFDIPVYLMGISAFPSAYLPELLGLNLAIELSGLGRVYLRLSEELNYWQINSAIIDIHTSIDNLASGHSALAIEAIKLYLDDISALNGQNSVNEHWRRIYTGYCSLKTASFRFKMALMKTYFLNGRMQS